MKDKMLKFMKKHIITTIILILYIVRIIQMFFSSTPTPPISQLLILMLGGSYFLISVSIFFNLTILNHNKKRHTTTTKGSTQSKRIEDKAITQISTDTVKIIENNTKHSHKIAYRQNFNVAGVTHECKLDQNMKRQEVLKYCSVKDQLHLEQYEYKGKSAYLIVLNKNNLDIGSVPKDLVPTIFHYKGQDTSIEFDEVSSFTKENLTREIFYAKVNFLVYKSESIPHRTQSYHKMFYLDDKFGPCFLDESKKKHDVIKQILPEDKYRVENIIHCDIHRQIIVNERLNLDIGMVPQELAITFYQYRNRSSEAIIIENIGSEIKMQFIVYKE